jgi:5-methyltetrahydrofolate--homocysteine methyltransferase
MEVADRPPHPRPGDRPLRAGVLRPDLRRAHLPALDRRRRPAPRRDRNHRGDPAHQRRAPRRVTTLGVSNVSFGLSPAARHVLNSVFLTSASRPGSLGDRARARRSCRSPASPIASATVASTSSGTGAAPPACSPKADDVRPAGERCSTCSPTSTAVEAVVEDRTDWTLEGASPTASSTATRRASPSTSTRQWHQGIAPLTIINDMLLAGMKIVGERFGAGEMQLPFVLQSAETMKAAVATSNRTWRRTTRTPARGASCLGTVKGDVHDIGKNLVDIILTNNGYRCTTSASRSRSPR